MSVPMLIQMSTRLISAFMLGVAVLLCPKASFAAEDPNLLPTKNNLPLWAGKTYEIKDSSWTLKFQASPDGKKYSAEIEGMGELMECSGSLGPSGVLINPDCITLMSMSTWAFWRSLTGSIYKMLLKTENSMSEGIFVNTELEDQEAENKKAPHLRAADLKRKKEREAEENADATQKADQALLAEIERLKQEAKEGRKALDAFRAKEAEERQRIAALEKRQAEDERRRDGELKRKKEADEKRRLAALEKKKKEKAARIKAAELKRKKEADEKRRLAKLEKKKKEVDKKRRLAAKAVTEKKRQGGGPSLEERVATLKRLKDVGLLTEEEFQARKNKVLDEFLGFGHRSSTASNPPAIKTKTSKYANVKFGKYYALVIGNNEYKYLPKLKTAAKDAKAVAKTLRDTFGFEVKTLINATHYQILDAFDDYDRTLEKTDNFLIYYAGHGWLDKQSEQGYWLPVDAKSNRRSKWISNPTITSTLKSLRAKHVMVVADSCFSGTLTRGLKVTKRIDDYVRYVVDKKARIVLTSGGLEPVEDGGGGNNSPFAKAFMDVLNGTDEVLTGTDLFKRIKRPVQVSADQTPNYADIRKAGHDGGDFLFVRKR